jgi:diguanylate cyclase (GGDEF)-like protein
MLEQVGTLLGRVVERDRSSALLRHQAEHDPLTNLANRRRLLQEITGAQEAASDDARAGCTALLLLDLDRFGVINSSFGHSIGDQILQEAARRIESAAPSGDFVARLGGDEFVVLVRLPGCLPDDQEPPLAAGRRVLAALSGPLQVGGQRLPIAASVGVCVIDAEHAAVAHYPAAVLRDADAALRVAKRAGKGRVAVFDNAMRTDALQRLTDETDLAAAISDGGLELHYQPVVELQTGRPTGAEALVRWRRQGHGLVRPDLFIPLAEECGLIVDLGRWVLRRACFDAQDWATTVPALATGRVSVNVSTRQLVHPHFLADVRAALADSGLPVQRLVLEITESALIEDREHTLGVLAALRGMGLQLALDDFGTGYSSLSWLQDLPADVLKIDKSFIDPVTGPGRGTALAEVVLKLAEVAGLQTVAEGIETAEQAEALRQLGCQFAQGYLWSRPLPLDALSALLGADTTTRQRWKERGAAAPLTRAPSIASAGPAR